MEIKFGSDGKPVLNFGPPAPAKPEPIQAPRITNNQQKSEFYKGVVKPGVDLENYRKVTPSEDGTYVVVTTHSEHIEKIKQPKTPEEKAEIRAQEDADRAAQHKQDVLAAKVLGGVTAAVVTVIGLAIAFDAYKVKKATDEKPEIV